MGQTIWVHTSTMRPMHTGPGAAIAPGLVNLDKLFFQVSEEVKDTSNLVSAQFYLLDQIHLYFSQSTVRGTVGPDSVPFGIQMEDVRRFLRKLAIVCVIICLAVAWGSRAWMCYMCL